MPRSNKYKDMPDRYGRRERQHGVGGPSGSELAPLVTMKCEFCKTLLGKSYWVNKLGYPVCEAVVCRRKSGILEGSYE